MPTDLAIQLAPKSFDELMSLTIEEIGTVDIGRANLLCAEGLPHAEDLDVEEHVGRLDSWAVRIQWMTQRHFSSFQANPQRFENSEPKWRLLVIAQVLNQEYAVGYHQKRIDSEPDWTDSQDLLIHGTTGDRRSGTCPSLPVLMVAIGRRLGYPVCLSTAAAHVFSRWDASQHESKSWRERFNVEFHGGVSFYDDEYYLHWPIEWPAQLKNMFRRGDRRLPYLRSLTPGEEFAHSLCQRAVCLEAVGRDTEAVNTYLACRRYDKVWGGYADFAKRTLRARAEVVMRSMGFDPPSLRGWLVQREVRRLTARVSGGMMWPPSPMTMPGFGSREPHLPGLSDLPGGGLPSNLQVALSRCAERLSHGVPPTNLESILQAILVKTCRGTPVRPTLDLLLPHPPEPKVDPYASLRDGDGTIPSTK